VSAVTAVGEGVAAERVLAPGAWEWPAALSDLGDAPPRVWWRGGAVPAHGASVAIVGARAATPYARGFAERLAHDLARAGRVVVSGLARGVDAAAHEGALAGGGVTVAVLPAALDHVTPPGHAALAARIAASGGLLTEVGAGGPFGRGAFVRRNRLIAALAAVTVVVEAAEGSGALTTAIVARRLGRVVLAVPGDVDRPGAVGPLALLRAGAGVCAGVGDVLAALARAGHAPAAVTPLDRLAAALGPEPRAVEELARVVGLEGGEVLALLLELEWAGRALARAGGRWERRG
jgi:DNA processing protein